MNRVIFGDCRDTMRDLKARGAEARKHMHREQALTVKRGDMLDPIGLWNASERARKLAYPTEVLDVRHERGCQTGVLLKVRFLSGAEAYLDAGWFNAPNVL